MYIKLTFDYINKMIKFFWKVYHVFFQFGQIGSEITVTRLQIDIVELVWYTSQTSGGYVQG